MEIITEDWKQVDKSYFIEYYNVGLIKKTENWTTEEFNEWYFKQYLNNGCLHESLDSTADLEELVVQELEQYEVQRLFKTLNINLKHSNNITIPVNGNYFLGSGFELIRLNKYTSIYLHKNSRELYYRLSDYLFDDDLFHERWLEEILPYSVPIFTEEGKLYDIMIQKHITFLIDNFRVCDSD